MHAERLGQRGGVAAGRGEAGQRHAGEAVRRPRRRRERDLQLGRADDGPGLAADAGVDLGVVIAIGAQQVAQQIGILARAAIDLRDVGGLAGILSERGQRIEALAQARRGDAVEPLESHDIAAIARPRRWSRRRGELRRHGGGATAARLPRLLDGQRAQRGVGLGEIGPGDAEIGQGRHRRIGIERRAGDRRCGSRRGLPASARGPR